MSSKLSARRCSRILFLGPGLYDSGYKEIKRLFRGRRNLHIDFGNNHAELSKGYDLGISMGYRRIIPPEFLSLPSHGVLVFHSSDLPKGRGWAPLYYALVERQTSLTVSLIFADAGVDSGDLIAKARCPIDPDETLTSLRRKDDILVLSLLERFLPRLAAGGVRGTPQKGRPTYKPRRKPEDSALATGQTLSQLFNRLRALDNERYPAFATLAGRKFWVRLEPAEPAERPVLPVITDYTRYSPNQ